MAILKAVFILLLLFYKNDLIGACTCGDFSHIEGGIQANDTDIELSKLENFNNLQDVKKESCETYDGPEFIEIVLHDPSSFSINLLSEKMEQESTNEEMAVKPLCVKIVAVCDCEQSKQIFIFVRDTNNHDPFFVDKNGERSNEFTYTIPMPSFASHDVNDQGQQIRAKDIDLSNVEITFEIEDNDDFEIISAGMIPETEDPLKKTHYATLKLKRMIYTDRATYKITAVDKDKNPNKKAEATLIILKNQDETISTDKFEKPHYQGRCNDVNICIENIKLTDGSKDVEIVDGDYKELFQFDEATGNIRLIGNSADIHEDLVILLLESRPANQLVPVNAVASILVPKSESGEEPELEISFEDHPPSFAIKSTETSKEIHRFKAISSDTRDMISYSLDDAGDKPKGIYLDNSGLLRSVDTISSGYHTLVITAKGDFSGLEAQTSVVLNVNNFEIGKNDTVHVLQSFTSMTIKENSEPVNVLAIDSEVIARGYKYEIVYQQPNNGLFEIVNGNVMSKTLDREADFFKDFRQPQFTLLVELTKEDNANPLRGNRTRSPRSLLKDYGIIEGINMFESLEYHALRTAVVILVGDENDHKPQFGMQKMTLCYPNEETVDLIKPAYLVQVKATDLDSPEGKGYGKITYSTDSEALIIDETTGIIYPTEEIFKSTTNTFTITATDGGNEKADLEIKVNLIDNTQIGELTLEGISPEDLEQELKELSQRSGFEIGTFSSPMNVGGTSTTRTVVLKTRIFIYALKDGVAVGANDIKEKLEQEENVVLIPLEPNGGSGNQGSDSGETADTTGLIAAVSVLSVLLVFFICAAGAYWYFKLRPMQLSLYADEIKIDEETPEVEEKNSRFEKNNNTLLTPSAVATRRPTGFPFPTSDSKLIFDENDNDSLSPSIDKTNDAIDSATKIEPEDNQPTGTKTSDSEDDADDSKNIRERRKSVTFRAAIEKIEIEKSGNDEEEEDDSGSSDSEDSVKDKKDDSSSSSDSEDDVKKEEDDKKDSDSN